MMTTFFTIRYEICTLKRIEQITIVIKELPWSGTHIPANASTAQTYLIIITAFSAKFRMSHLYKLFVEVAISVTLNDTL